MKHGIDPANKKIVAGFSLLELMIVLTILLVLVVLAVPNLLRTVHVARLQAAGTDFSGLLQQARLRAVQDDRFYSVYQIASTGLTQDFVDIYPQNVNGASGSGGATLDSRDPVISVASEITEQAPAAAPNTSNLTLQMLGSNPSKLTPLDGSAAGTPITFGPQGLPCAPVAVSGGTVCNSRGGPVAYWVFFQNSNTQTWEAVTVTPAGRIQKWLYSGTTWARL